MKLHPLLEDLWSKFKGYFQQMQEDDKEGLWNSLNEISDKLFTLDERENLDRALTKRMFFDDKEILQKRRK